MSYRRRKRSIRRPHLPLEQHEGLYVTGSNDEGAEEQQQEQGVPSKSPLDGEVREREIWDSFREEHYEVVEQLPLSLHRAYALIRELDQQVHDYNDQLSHSLKLYASRRNSIAQAAVDTSDVTMDVNDTSLDEAATSSPQRSTRISSKRFQQSMSREAALPPSTRELLKRIAQLSEDVMSASYEKLSLARFACDLIDRHTRDLERATKEQETSLSVGLRPGTHPASIILPDVVVPPAIRAPRVIHSPIPDDEDFPDQPSAPPEAELAIDTERDVNSAVSEKSARTGKRPRGRSHRKKEGSTAPKGSSSSPHRPGITLTLPPLASIKAHTEALQKPMDPILDDEPRYCYCNGVSAGDMIACDAAGCKYQWFHMECLQMKEAPPGEYICPDCLHSAASKPVRKRKRR
ncbi:hypothetical protein BDY19DRAFT_1059590 [Irpex rosettiformis]|uniref:Uncharacterized protein n=1 Tax=Irpex rosettiformis TaxID=378272 RepID=A0ACB8TTN9_9APHY|nr:hypothetical protein BDY19DRAFT_1059590 [Irpex rosettiformis]